MARRKSPWQQFADNFDSVYGTFNKFGSAMETRGIMNEKPEEEIIQEGPRNSYERATGKWTYGGKTYDKEITADELRGLQYNRLGDVMAKYGDPTGAMAMRTSAADIKSKAATLEAQQTSNEIALETKDAVIKLASIKNANIEANTANTVGNTNLTSAQLKLFLDTLDEKVAQEVLKTEGLEWDNESKKYKAILEEATLADKIKISGIEVDRAQVDLANERLKGEGWKIDNAGNLIKLGIDRATQKDEIALKGLEVEGKKQANINAALYGTGLKYDNRGKLVAAETAEDTQESTTARITAEDEASMDVAKATSTAARLENNANVTLLNYSKELKKGTFKDGGGVEWLEKNWTGDPKVKELINTLKDDELNDIMREGVVMMTNVEAAISGKTSLDAVKDDLTKLIDDQDSIPGNVEIKQGESGAVWLIETDADGNVTSEIKGKDFEEFKQNLIKTMSPMRSVSIATANAQLRKTEAQIQEIIDAGLDPNKVNADWAGIETALISYAPDITVEEIAERKKIYIDGLLYKEDVSGKGIGNSDGKWSSTQL